jgi:tRNA A-37 threonylcarbamoyl transferase component Bud32
MIGTQLSGRYKLVSKLGSGGMSTVYLAVDETLDREVAIKVLHREISDQPDQLERFRREARAVARLSHPNLVGVIDAGEDGGHPYIVFEYVPGQTLKKRIDEQGRLGLDEATAYAIEIGRGLACAHAARLIHRDVKPQNVLIDAEGRAKITDFGIARSLEAHGLTATGRVLGTTDYVSPEQAMGQPVDARTDVYSLGVVLYEMLVGDVPFKAETQVGVAMKHVNEDMPNVQLRRPEVSAALAAALERATAKEPADRYPDMNAFLSDLEGALEVEVSRAGHSTGEATTVLRSVPNPRKILTRTRISWAGALLLIAAAAAALIFASLTGEDKPSKGSQPVEQGGGEEIEIAAAVDFDPVASGGDGVEHDTEVGLAIDGDEATSWTTETYSDGLADGNPKEGVGLVLDAGDDVEPTELALETDGGGWTYEVYAAAGPTAPEELGEFGEPISDLITADSKSSLAEISPAEPSQYFLVWITSIPAGAAAEVGDASLVG